MRAYSIERNGSASRCRLSRHSGSTEVTIGIPIDCIKVSIDIINLVNKSYARTYDYFDYFISRRANKVGGWQCIPFPH